MTSQMKNTTSTYDSASTQSDALEFVSKIIQTELAIGYYLKVSNTNDTHIEVTIISPEINCPVTIKVPVNFSSENDNVKNWKRIKEEISKCLK
ncbi:hypothetical protein VCO01S_20800 [Vibrio comitans NBRC 102076]|uniref:Uncharacterized protein n=2 Tax=Vibrio comitans TaxID=413401 RepID=A0A4Y3INR3_9VIBR|nr:hypothetical protein VCO01S_20800 [Vibrio comitans NBRC 102076]